MVETGVFLYLSDLHKALSCTATKDSAVELKVDDIVTVNWLCTEWSTRLIVDDHRALRAHINVVEPVDQKFPLSSNIAAVSTVLLFAYPSLSLNHSLEGFTKLFLVFSCL